MSLEAWGDEGDIGPEGYVTEERCTEIVNEATEQLQNALNGLLGLLVLIAGRDDVSAELREVLKTNHRVLEAQQIAQTAERGEFGA